MVSFVENDLKVQPTLTKLYFKEPPFSTFIVIELHFVVNLKVPTAVTSLDVHLFLTKITMFGL